MVARSKRTYQAASKLRLSVELYHQSQLTTVDSILSSASGSVRYSSLWKLVNADWVVFNTLKSRMPDFTKGFSVEEYMYKQGVQPRLVLVVNFFQKSPQKTV